MLPCIFFQTPKTIILHNENYPYIERLDNIIGIEEYGHPKGEYTFHLKNSEIEKKIKNIEQMIVLD